MPSSVSHKEKILSGIGGVLGIFFTFYITSKLIPNANFAYIVPSFGASAVLLFAIPHGPLSQPWNLFAGHLVSAFIGVTCAQYFHNEMFAAALAVGLAISAQYYLRCLHPPGGATALVAVIAGKAITDLGYWFLLTPVLINVVIIFIVAVLFNYGFKGRRYPVALVDKALVKKDDSSLTHANIVVALSELDAYVDISEEDLLKIYDIATRDLAKS